MTCRRSARLFIAEIKLCRYFAAGAVNADDDALAAVGRIGADHGEPLIYAGDRAARVAGGMGTTSVTAALAWALQQLGESVLAIDFTPDNLLRLHFNTPFELARGWARAERDGGRWQEGALRYCENLDFLPFGRLECGGTAGSAAPVSATAGTLARQCAPTDRRRSAALILLDVPVGDGVLAQQALQLADSVFGAVEPRRQLPGTAPSADAAERLPFRSITTPASQLQQDLHQLWLQTLSGLLPVVIHRDEALAEALAVKQPLASTAPRVWRRMKR